MEHFLEAGKGREAFGSIVWAWADLRRRFGVNKSCFDLQNLAAGLGDLPAV